MDSSKNFAKSNVSTGYDSSATTIVLVTGGGAKMPSVPFNAVWWDSSVYADPADDPNVEVIRVTNISTDTLTITRAQESTSAANHNTSGHTYKVIAPLTSKFVTDLSSALKPFEFTIPPPVSTGVSTTLNGAINNAVTALTVNSATGFPAVPFLIQIGSEVIEVTAASGTSFSTVVRGWDGSTAASHSNGDTVTLLNWSWIAQGPATATQSGNNIVVDSGTPTNTVSRHAYQRPIGTKTVLIAGMYFYGLTAISAVRFVGVHLHESSSGKAFDLEFAPSSGGPVVYVAHFASPYATTAGVVDAGPLYAYPNSPVIWVKIDLSTANILVYMSNDKITWSQVHSVAKTSVFTTAPDEWGVCIITSTGTTYNVGLTLVSWSEA